jgi:hypothetical protein
MMVVVRSDESCFDRMESAYMEGLDDIERLPESRTRAESAKDFACSVGILNTNKQRIAFDRATKMITLPDLLCDVASSVESARPITRPYLIHSLIEQAESMGNCKNVYKGIGQVTGQFDENIKQWYSTRMESFWINSGTSLY